MSQAKYHVYVKILHLKSDAGTFATTYLEVNYSKHLFKRTFNLTTASLKLAEQSSVGRQTLKKKALQAS